MRLTPLAAYAAGLSATYVPAEPVGPARGTPAGRDGTWPSSAHVRGVPAAVRTPVYDVEAPLRSAGVVVLADPALPLVAAAESAVSGTGIRPGGTW